MLLNTVNFLIINHDKYYKLYDVWDQKIDKQYEWDVVSLDIYPGDDYHKMNKNTDIEEVKKKCIELGSNLFIAKPNCQYYISSPPSVKKK